MAWTVQFHPDFDAEFEALDGAVQDELLAILGLLKIDGPHKGRPHVDTLEGSKHANLKEIRFKADDGVWRFAFAFDPKREAVILCGGDKSGVSERQFYKALIVKADKRFDAWLEENGK